MLYHKDVSQNVLTQITINLFCLSENKISRTGTLGRGNTYIIDLVQRGFMPCLSGMP